MNKWEPWHVLVLVGIVVITGLFVLAMLVDAGVVK